MIYPTGGIMKICSRCKEEKDYDGFYKDKAAKDGFNSICKKCRLEMDRTRRESDIVWKEKKKLQNIIYHEKNREAIAERKKAWLSSDEGKKSHRESTRKWKKKNRDAVLAHRAVERAVKKGILIPETNCEICNGTTRIEAHHPDHRFRLKVIWLCKYCHEKLT
ncbi:MAG TPA: hypothetical protein VL443_29435 [Cyclobacteriaceae bacterium]|nr:hypothetical protein [Cyclobacteriaceae bacterium]